METGDLMEVAARLERAESPIHDQNAIRGLVALEESVGKAEAAWSGSWLGYHSRVYYKGLNPPPSGARFSHEWGLLEREGVGRASTGDWRKGRVEDVIAIIWKNAGHPNINAIRQESVVAAQIFEAAKHEILSHLKALVEGRPDDDALARVVTKIRQSTILGSQEHIEKWMPAELPFSRDSFAVGEGLQVPPHITVKAEISAIRQPFTACGELARTVRRLMSQLSHSGDPNKPRLSGIIPRVITVHPQPPGRTRKPSELAATLDSPEALPSVTPVPGPAPKEDRSENSSSAPHADAATVETPPPEPEEAPAATASVTPAASMAVARPIGMRAPPPSAREPADPVPVPMSPVTVSRPAGLRPPDSAAAKVSLPEGGTGQFGVCLCHGRSGDWKGLRDVLRKELPRDYHEFNLVPPAGVSGREKVDELCRACGLAVLVLTEEDKHLQDERHMETYAIHAAGVFQGRLGYSRVVLLIEEGWEGLSHLSDLPQITYPRGGIKGVVGEIKAVLAREGLLQP